MFCSFYLERKLVDDYVLLFFDVDNTYMIVKSCECKDLTEENGSVKYGGQWYTGTVRYRGDYNK